MLVARHGRKFNTGRCNVHLQVANVITRRHYTVPPLNASDPANPKTKLLTLTHKARGLLPRVLLPLSDGSKTWERCLDRIYEDCSSTSVEKRKPKIIVWGGSENKRRNVVRAILDDPIALDPEEREALRTRWETRENLERLTISSSPNAARNLESKGTIFLKLPMLERLNATLVELNLPSTTNIPLDPILDSDIALHISSDSLDPLPILPNTLHITLTTSPSETPGGLNAELAQDAIDTLASNTKATSAVDVYQHNIPLSGLPAIHEAIFKSLSRSQHHSSKELLLSFLVACGDQISMARSEILDVEKKLVVLQDSINATKAFSATLFSNELSPSRIEELMKQATTAIHQILDFPWIKLQIRTDDLSIDLNRVLQAYWGRGIENVLYYNAAILSSYHKSLHTLTNQTLSSLPTTLPSALLQNSFDQLPSRPPSPPSLLTPLTTRLNTLNTHVVPFTHQRAEQAVLITSLTLISSVGISCGLGIWEYVGWETAFGLGALGTVLSLRWRVKKWEKIKREWWKNWARTRGGLERDLKNTFELAVNDVVLKGPLLVVSRLEDMLQKRKEEVDSVALETESLKRMVEEIQL